ncbi:hypothetical protein D3C85_440910 [compost metagenome]
MKIKATSKGMEVAIIIGLYAFIIIILLAFVYGFRAFSQATMPSNLTSPRPGIECYTVSGSDGVAVSCYPTAGLPPRAE